ncbi:AGAP004127-PA-like protein [Anopheles sinensis]|uniref:AGAP004127-PA-like protein n=1 Tax=Anopheles sinensis TaxID=74873 RepID=A0A084VL81_ANOSI|nr:AGAP004127-PA-like protein [Anopheles sinensis]
MSFKKVVSILVICVVAVQGASVARKAEAAASVADELSWSCVNNVTCVAGLAKDVIQKLQSRRSVDFGVFSVQPLERLPLSVDGRSSGALDFLSSHALKVPLGPMVVNVERSADYPNFVEVSLLKKDDGARGRTRKHMRFFVPAFLVFSQIGWYALAIAGVKLLAIKAFLVAKIALIVVAMMTFKKLMEPVAVMPAPYFDHPEPFMMPYGMDFHHGFPGAANDMYSMGLGGHLGHHDGPSALHASEGGLGAASNVNPSVVDAASAASDKSASSPAQPASVVASGNERHHFGASSKIKRQDFYPQAQSAKYL